MNKRTDHKMGIQREKACGKMHCLHFIGHKNNLTVNNATASIIQFIFILFS